VLLVCIYCFTATIPAWTQSTDTGTIAGTVSDPSGAVVPGVNVTLKDTTTGSSRSTATNAAGRYIFVNITPRQI
jgi:hypothetical protein